MRNQNNTNRYNGLKVEKVKFGYKCNNNCYTYAINQPLDPYTHDAYEDYSHCQPGVLGGLMKRDKECPHFDYTNFIKYVRRDLRDIGFKIKKSTIDEYINNDRAWKIAFCYGISDYHFYRQNKNGTWSHKQGPAKIITKDESGKQIYNPKLCDRGKYMHFVGFFIIYPMDN